MSFMFSGSDPTWRDEVIPATPSVGAQRTPSLDAKRFFPQGIALSVVAFAIAVAPVLKASLSAASERVAVAVTPAGLTSDTEFSDADYDRAWASAKRLIKEHGGDVATVLKTAGIALSRSFEPLDFEKLDYPD